MDSEASESGVKEPWRQQPSVPENPAVAAARAALHRPGMAAVVAHIPGGSTVVGESATERFRLA